jgi:hypothetical protein
MNEQDTGSSEPMNVLLFTAPDASGAVVALHDRTLAALEAAAHVEVLSVKLPRAESMLLSRIVGLWHALVFFGGSGAADLPTAERVLEESSALMDKPPLMVLVCHPADLWPSWDTFQAHLYRSAADQRMVEPDRSDALEAILQALGLEPLILEPLIDQQARDRAGVQHSEDRFNDHSRTKPERPRG